MENVQEIARGETDTKSFFKVLKDGNGVEIKVINLDNPNVCKRQGLVEVVPLRERKNSNNVVIYPSRATFKRFIDRETKCSVGIIEGIDPKTKEFKYKSIAIEGRRIYDLSDINDAQELACIKISPYLEGSPNQDRSSPPMFKIYDKEKQAHENLAKVKNRRKAEHAADSLTGDLLDDMLKACGIGVIGMSEVSKQYAIIKYAEDHADIFLKHFESPTRAEAFLLKQAVEHDIVQNNTDVGFIYRTTVLGLNEQIAIEYLVGHPNISAAIQTLVDMKKDETAKSNKVEKVIDTDAELQSAKDEVAKLRAELAKSVNKNAEAELGHSLDTDQEYEDLKLRAKNLKIKSWHTKSKENLKKEVEEAEAKN